jgi:hypothetical protein
VAGGLPRARQRVSGTALVVLAVVAALASIALAVAAWVARGHEGRASVASEPTGLPAQALRVLAAPGSVRIPLARSKERLVLVVARGDRAVIVLQGLGSSPAGRTYQAWVTPPGARRPLSAALFSGREQVVLLHRRVRAGATVAVTLERAGGAAAPSRTPRLVARRP